MIYTHQKRPYKANCVQYTGSEVEVITKILSSMPEVEVSLHTDNITIILRHLVGMDILQPGDWVVVGENGNIKSYSNETFNIKYKKLDLNEYD